MPDEVFPTSTSDVLTDEAIEAILQGRLEQPDRPWGDGSDLLAEFAQDVRTVADRPAPRPNASLAAVLATGFSTDKGDLLVTAASNVNGPAEQAAGLPKWRKRQSMLPTGIFSGLVAKIVAGIAAALAGVTAVGAAGALPGPAQHAVANVINTVTPFNVPTGDASASITTNTGGPTSTAAGLNVNTGTSGATSGDAGATVGASTPVSHASVTAGTNTSGGGTTANVGATVTPNIPGLPNLSNLPAGLPAVQIPDCVKNIVDVKTGQPKVPLNQISSQVINCVKTLMSTASSSVPSGLPAGLSDCVNSILNLATSVGANPGSVPSISGFDFSKCVPVDVTKCMSSVFSMIQNFMPGGGFGFGFGGSAGTTGSTANAGASGGATIPGLSGLNLAGCVPFNLNACLSSLFSMAGNLPGAGTGGIPGLGSGALPSVGNLDLSSCVPFNSLAGSIPGLGSFAGLLPH